MSRLRCLFRGHDEVAAVSRREPVVRILCRRCDRRRSLPLVGSWPLRYVPDGVALVDAHAFAELRAAYLVEMAFQEVDPWQ